MEISKEVAKNIFLLVFVIAFIVMVGKGLYDAFETLPDRMGTVANSLNK
ncbi:hypothetical protein OIN60_20690 [Paenibacillus sp. P96]|uniref:Uncharacterized protein n=1 Tax=Paenibacillus zeirhizosphaerae TaxID=2987519 RepID=A0ABT9FWN3_9BACL|nr:hypothetical protein [Paenibacillus sp. P96]MDP4099141.1 hypothetical protein [Paenibacillus sp. P96]